MLKYTFGYFSKSICFALALLLMLLLAFPLNVRPVQAGTGITVNIPASNITPTMDGVCSPSEYVDAIQVSVTVGTQSFPVYMKHTGTDAYFCFGDASGLPLPNGGASSVTVYIDRTNDGIVSGNNGDDFGVWMPYDPTPAGAPFAAYWGTGTYNGADPGGWQAVKHQVGGSSPLWQVEFRISRQTMGGWNHTVGLALFYHWWQRVSDDYSWPANGIWKAPQLWANGALTTGKVTIGNSATVPTVDGQCSSPEYSDASTITFNVSSSPVTAYLKHSLTDLYVCLHNLTVPAVSQQTAPNAALYIDRSGTGGGAPSASDISVTISYSGIVFASSGDGVGFGGPDPGGYSVARFQYSGGWDAEFRISSATIGNWYSRTIGLTVAEQNVNSPGNDFGWPAGYSNLVPSSWGEANLIGLGHQAYLPFLVR